MAFAEMIPNLAKVTDLAPAIFYRKREGQFPDNVAGSSLHLESPWRKNESIVCVKAPPPGGGIVHCVRLDDGVRGGFDPIPRWGSRHPHSKSVGGTLYDPDGLSGADNGGVWSHHVLWKKHLVGSGDHPLLCFRRGGGNEGLHHLPYAGAGAMRRQCRHVNQP